MRSVSPTGQALRALELIQHRPGIGADELAGRLGVTDRAVRRYIATLRAAGVPVESERGRQGGYRLGRALRPPPLVFTASEALGLVMAVLDGHHAAADPEDPVGSALGKLIRALPAHTGHQAATVRAHAMAAPDRRAVRPDPTITGVLVDAVAAGRAVRITYTPESGTPLETGVDPWAVVVRHGRWYLLCLAHAAGAARAYRIDRIGTVTALNADAAPPPTDLNPVAWLEEHLRTGWRFETCVAFDAPMAEVAPFLPAPMGRLEPAADGAGAGCVLRGTTSNPTMYASEWLAAVPFPFRVISGPELRDAVAAVGRRMIDAVTPAG